jgi:hypothetical protein
MNKCLNEHLTMTVLAATVSYVFYILVAREDCEVYDNLDGPVLNLDF